MAAHKNLRLDVLTPTGPRYKDVAVAGVEVPGLLGELGVLPQHTAFVTAVAPGVVRFVDAGDAVRLAVGTGFVEITEDGHAVLLVEQAVEAGEVDVEACQARLAEVRQALGEHRESIDAGSFATLSNERAFLEAQLRAAGQSPRA